MPALIIVESWRVKMTSSSFFARPGRAATLLPPDVTPPPAAAAARLDASATSRMTRFLRRSSDTTSAGAFATRVPRTVLPSLVFAEYLKVGMGLLRSRRISRRE